MPGRARSPRCAASMQRAGRVADRGAARAATTARMLLEPRELLGVHRMLGLVGAREMRHDEVEREVVEQVLALRERGDVGAREGRADSCRCRGAAARGPCRASARPARGVFNTGLASSSTSASAVLASAPSNTPISASGAKRAQLARFGERRDEEPPAPLAQQAAHDALDAEAVGIGLDDGGALAGLRALAQHAGSCAPTRRDRCAASPAATTRSPAQSTYGGKLTLTTQRARSSATMRYAPTSAGTNADSPRSSVPSSLPSPRHADAARERVQRVRRRCRHVDGESGRRLEMLEPKVLAIDGPAHTGPHELRLDDELLGPRRRRDSTPRALRRCRCHAAENARCPTRATSGPGGGSRARTRRGPRDCRARAPPPRGGLPLAAAIRAGFAL